MRHICNSLTVIGLGLVLTGCGFHLRGNVHMPAQLSTMTIVASPKEKQISEAISAQLKASGVRLTANSRWQLHILNEHLNRSFNGLSANTQVRQYIITDSVSYQLSRSNGKPVLPVRTISSSRNWTVNANQVLGSSAEEQTLIAEMRNEIAQKLVAQLAARDTIAACMGLNKRTS